MTDENKIEQAIQAANATAPRITPADVDAAIVSEHYFTASDGRDGAIANETYHGKEVPQDGVDDLLPLKLLTLCVLVLRNGFTVTGESACVSAENFNAAIGRKVAYDNARAKVWPLLGYCLRQELASEVQ